MDSKRNFSFAMLGLMFLGFGATVSRADWTVGRVVGVDVFDSQRARYTVKEGNGNTRAFWIMVEASTGKAMLSTVILAASIGSTVKVWHYNSTESFGGQSGTPTSIIFQEIPN
jgi:hypothetical protein